MGGTTDQVFASRLSEESDVSVFVLDRGHAKERLIFPVQLISLNIMLDMIL